MKIGKYEIKLKGYLYFQMFIAFIIGMFIAIRIISASDKADNQTNSFLVIIGGILIAITTILFCIMAYFFDKAFDKSINIKEVKQ